MKKEIYINSADEMISLGEAIGKVLEPNMVIALDGDLGAGKTTLTKGIAKGLGINKIVNSPTFVIMKIYEGRLTLYHLDVYRTNDSEFELSEYFEMGGVSVIEWSRYIESLLPKGCLHIYISRLDNNKRQLWIEWEDKAYDKVVEAI